jgi:RNA polymerase sigma factor (sigma-70 family)
MTVADEELMLQVRNGEVETLGVLFDRYQTPLYNFYTKMTQDRSLSEDLVQDVFLRILRYRHTYRPDTPFRAWVYQIARNARVDAARKAKPEVPMLTEPMGPAATDSAQQKQEAALLQRALLQLPEDKREILILSRFQELKYEEIARMMGCEVGTVKVRVHRAVQQLREVFRQLERTAGNKQTDRPGGQLPSSRTWQ